MMPENQAYDPYNARFVEERMHNLWFHLHKERIKWTPKPHLYTHPVANLNVTALRQLHPFKTSLSFTDPDVEVEAILARPMLPQAQRIISFDAFETKRAIIECIKGYDKLGTAEFEKDWNLYGAVNPARKTHLKVLQDPYFGQSSRARVAARNQAVIDKHTKGVRKLAEQKALRNRIAKEKRDEKKNKKNPKNGKNSTR